MNHVLAGEIFPFLLFKSILLFIIYTTIFYYYLGAQIIDSITCKLTLLNKYCLIFWEPTIPGTVGLGYIATYALLGQTLNPHHCMFKLFCNKSLKWESFSMSFTTRSYLVLNIALTHICLCYSQLYVYIIA